MQFDLYVNNVTQSASGPGITSQNISLVGVPGLAQGVSAVSINLSSPNDAIKAILGAGKKFRITLDTITE